MKNYYNIKKPLVFFYSLIICVSCSTPEASNKEGIKADNRSISNGTSFNRDPKSINFSGLKFNAWDVGAASKNISKRKKKPYTIMVFMNGSDLESETGAATDDLIEMLDSGVDSKNLNLILFTGGSNRWQNDTIPENNCMLWEVADGSINKLSGVGLVDMGDPGTLSSFIDFSTSNFPADKYGLVLWDHGGGTIIGYGSDEKFNESSLTLLDLNYAFEKSALSKNKLEFLGFDSCLMGSVEMSVVASDYANYLIASEDLEPGAGWDYSFLSVFNKNPNIGGAELGKTIVDSFISYYGMGSEEILNLSVTDLSKVDAVMAEMGNLMALCSNSLGEGQLTSFRSLSKKRNGTKTFGEGSPRDNDCDMVDIGDMAINLSDLYPEQAAKLLAALDKAVIYNKNNYGGNLKGLSAYYIYGGIDGGELSLDLYEALSMSPQYTSYLNNFYLSLANTLNNTKSRSGTGTTGAIDIVKEDIIDTKLTLWQKLSGGRFIMAGSVTMAEGNDQIDIAGYGKSRLWPSVNNKNVCLYKISSTNSLAFYAIPATHNGQSCDIIVMASEENPNGVILGVRHEEGIVIQKGLDPIKKGDKIAFHYLERLGDNNFEWYESEEITAEGELKLEWAKLTGTDNYFCLVKTDVHQNEHYGKLVQ
ncbi:MAG: hypothetical protein LBV08_05210 [Clostridiales bacterium]|jgi:hypothetical protein|nr:hypothetical protein [Clostridiales bacterium]